MVTRLKEIHPLCIPCYRHTVSMKGDLPHDPAWPQETCEACGRPTNHGIYVTKLVIVQAKEILTHGENAVRSAATANTG